MSVYSSASSKGLGSIRTMSDLISETSNPQRKYLKLAMLSMERVRRDKERRSAQMRVRDIDRRAAEIDVARRELLKSAHAECDLEQPEQEVRRPRGSHEQTPCGLKVKY